ncbi:M16 family metallopeptidase [Patescibacteria group bacterium]
MWKDPYSCFESKVLPNGLTLYANHQSGCPWESVGFLIHSGAEQDPRGLEGLAHFVEHLVSENSKYSNKEINLFFENIGGSVSLGETGMLNTEYGFFIPISSKCNLKKSFDIFGDMLLSARIEKLIERERRIVLGEFYQRYRTPFDFKLEMKKNQALHSGRCLMISGNSESIERITKSDLQEYYDLNYVPANISIVGVGGLSISDLTDLVLDSPFSQEKVGSRTPLPEQMENVGRSLEEGYCFSMSEKYQVSFEVGLYRSFAKIPGNVNRQVLIIMEKMLDDILFREIREKRSWAYDACSRWSRFAEFFEFSIDCGGLSLEAFDDIEGTVRHCIESLDDVHLFERKKLFEVNNITLFDLNAQQLCRNSISDLYRYGRIVSMDEYRKSIECVTLNDVRDLTRWIAPEMRWTLIAKP